MNILDLFRMWNEFRALVTDDTPEVVRWLMDEFTMSESTAVKTHVVFETWVNDDMPDHGGI